MKTPEDEAFDDLARKQGDWGGGYQAKRQMAADKMQPANNFHPDWDAMAVMVEEQQRMAKRIEELEAMLERQTSRIVDLQAHIENFEGEE